MSEPKSQSDYVQLLMVSLNVQEQIELREHLKGEAYDYFILSIALANPFFRLTDEEAARFRDPVEHADLKRLVALRDLASRSRTPKYSVFCMPKSGSSFVHTALAHALQLPTRSMLGFGIGGASSYFGMNSREQEIDELALTKSILQSPKGFVAQNHTRYSQYLALQLRFFRVTPIVTMRNILDCIVSYDDMMVRGRTGATAGDVWTTDPQFALPLDYPQLAPQARYDLLAKSFGVWLINFFLGWKRGIAQKVISPLVIRYEEDVLDPSRFMERIREHVPMTPAQVDRLADYVRAPDRDKSRLNVGVRGRGHEKIPDELKAFLAGYARAFAPEITDDDLRYLIA